MSKISKIRTFKDIRIEKQKLRYEATIYQEKLKNETKVFPGEFRATTGDIMLALRNRFFVFSLLRVLTKTRWFPRMVLRFFPNL